MKIITLLTDFGLKDPYVAHMKGIILSIARDVCIVDLSHDIHPQNIKQGAFLLYTSLPYFPKGSVHLAVVDPGVGTSRRGIVVECKDHVLIGPDNGLLLPAVKRFGEFRVYEIVNRKYFLDKVSNTFHGRDVFAPVAAHIANGVSLDEIGREIDDYADLEIGFGKVYGKRIEGEIIHVDRFGNLITNVEGSLINGRIEYGKEAELFVRNKRYRLRFERSYGYLNEGDLLLTLGGLGFLEISVNRGSACDMIGAKVGDKIILVL